MIVVNLLEVVEVEHGNTPERPLRIHMLDKPVEFQLKCPSVGKLGERIRQRRMEQLRLHHLAVGYVAKHADNAFDNPGVVAHRAAVGLEPSFNATRREGSVFEADHRAATA